MPTIYFQSACACFMNMRAESVQGTERAPCTLCTACPWKSIRLLVSACVNIPWEKDRETSQNGKTIPNTPKYFQMHTDKYHLFSHVDYVTAGCFSSVSAGIEHEIMSWNVFKEEKSRHAFKEQPSHFNQSCPTIWTRHLGRFHNLKNPPNFTTSRFQIN